MKHSPLLVQDMVVKIPAPVCEVAANAAAAAPSVLLHVKCGSKSRVCDSRGLAHLGNNRQIQVACHVLLGTGNKDAGLPCLEGNQVWLLLYLLGALGRNGSDQNIISTLEII